MDRKAGYLISIFAVIIFALFVVLAAGGGSSHDSAHSKIVKKALDAPDDVKGVFQNIYVAYKEPEKEHEAFVEIEDAHDVAEHKSEKKVEEKLEEGVIKMDNPIYAKHKKPIVLFTHLKHINDYKIGCGDCHHDDSAEPLNDITLESSVSSCAECHDKPSRKPKGEELSREEVLSYHAEALHDNCIVCHKKAVKEQGAKNAPTSCTKCHKK
jgi:hypothetical protein